MHCFTVDRFREERFSLKEFLDEIYRLSRSSLPQAQTILAQSQEMYKLKDALEYKEQELLHSTELSTEAYDMKEEIESVANSLSSLHLSPESDAFCLLVRERNTAQKKLRFIEYLAMLESHALGDALKASGEWLVLAEFFSLFRGCSGLSEPLQAEAAQMEAKLKRRVQKEYTTKLDASEIEEAAALTPVLFLLQSLEFSVDYLLQTSGEQPQYVSAPCRPLELLQSQRMPSLQAYLQKATGTVTKKVTLSKALLLKVEKQGVGGSAGIDYSYTFKVFEKVAGKVLTPLLDDLSATSDVCEYLIKTEAILKQVLSLKVAVSALLPEARDKIKQCQLLQVSSSDLLNKEIEAIQRVTDMLVGKKSSVYTINTLPLGESTSDIDTLFKLLALCRRSMLRGRLFEFSIQETKTLFISYFSSVSLIISKKSNYSKSFIFLSLHLTLVLITTTVFTNGTSPKEKEVLDLLVKKFLTEENQRSQAIYRKEKALLHQEVLSLAVQVKTKEVIEQLNSSFKYVANTEIFDAVVEDTLLGIAAALKKHVLPDPDTKKYLGLVKELRKYAKKLEAYETQKELARLKRLIEASLVDPEDKERILGALDATPEERAALSPKPLE
ncbi:hypothetical protein NEDG_01375 [Nematocida displodere]|uniref:Uncharacterized protein n=1 Tax=Nematocida displodere TaxID=1805483 RepID=A0A177EDR3_9MICR|nr:hypothetical protein NEDG_01375 [Nematocida displodere]